MRIGPLCHLVLAVLFLPGNTAALAMDQWGDDQASVRAAAGGELVIDGPQRLIHHGTYAGIPVTVNRRFDDGGLRQVRYFNRADHRRPVDYIEDFERLRRHLTDTYGKPDLDLREWRSDALRERPGMDGMALAGGKLFLVAGWETPEALILMTLQREHTAIAHQLVFTDPEADPEAFGTGQ